MTRVYVWAFKRNAVYAAIHAPNSAGGMLASLRREGWRAFSRPL